MRRILIAIGALAAIAAPAHAAGILTVPINSSERISLNGAAANVFIGNAAIADVAIINRNTVVVTGKGYGQTNLLVLNSAGRTILERQVQVGAGGAGQMTLYRSVAPTSFTCAPSCESTAQSGPQAPPAAAPAQP